jgi:hypothetical protein
MWPYLNYEKNMRKKHELPTLFKLSADSVTNYKFLELTSYVLEEENPDFSIVEEWLSKLHPLSVEGLDLSIKNYNNKNAKFRYKQISQIIYQIFKSKPDLLTDLQKSNGYSYEYEIIFSKHDFPYKFSACFFNLLANVYTERNARMNKIKENCQYFKLKSKEITNKCNAELKIYINVKEEIQNNLISHWQTLRTLPSKEMGEIFNACWIWEFEKVLLAIIKDPNALSQLIIMFNELEYDITSFMHIINNEMDNPEIIEVLIPAIFKAFKLKKPDEYLFILLAAADDIYNVVTKHKLYNYLKLIVDEVLSRPREYIKCMTQSVFDVALYDENNLKFPEIRVEEIKIMTEASLGQFLVSTYISHIYQDPSDSMIINYIKKFLFTEKSKADFVFKAHLNIHLSHKDRPMHEDKFLTLLKKISTDTLEMGKPDQALINELVDQHNPRPSSCVIS